MPTVMTHAALGWAATRVGRRLGVRLDGRVALAAAALAVLPDLDVIGHWLGVPYRSPLGHRGLSHSLLFALATSGAACWLLRRSGSPVGIGVFAVLVVATSSHALLDMLSDAGLGCALASPLHDGRYFWPFRPLPTSPLSFHPRVLYVLGWEIVLLWPGVAAAALLGSRLSTRVRLGLAFGTAAVAALSWTLRLS